VTEQDWYSVRLGRLALLSVEQLLVRQQSLNSLLKYAQRSAAPVVPGAVSASDCSAVKSLYSCVFSPILAA
jgi:hypothetical protein